MKTYVRMTNSNLCINKIKIKRKQMIGRPNYMQSQMAKSKPSQKLLILTDMGRSHCLINWCNYNKFSNLKLIGRRYIKHRFETVMMRCRIFTKNTLMSF